MKGDTHTHTLHKYLQKAHTLKQQTAEKVSFLNPQQIIITLLLIILAVLGVKLVHITQQSRPFHVETKSQEMDLNG